MSRRRALAALGFYLLALGAVTLGASPARILHAAAELLQHVEALQWVTKGRLELGANVLLFVPAGLLLCYVLPRVPRPLVWFLCLLGSGAVELAQTVLPVRQASLLDVVANSTGAALGVLLHVVVSHWQRRRSRRHRAAEERPVNFTA